MTASKPYFVNIFGEPVRPERMPRARRVSTPGLKRVEDPAKATKHFGFEVLAISEQAVLEAETSWHKKRAGGKLAPAEFDREAWLNQATPKRAIRRVFSVPEAAEQAAAMLRAGGGLPPRAGRCDSEGVRC